eukprot:scpid75352/ scgid21375/ Probable rhodanese domain-containing dual specificity protein phosphatase
MASGGGAGAVPMRQVHAGSSGAIPAPAIVWISNTDLFNKLQFGSNMMLVDLQKRECFDKYHVRSALNIDWNRALQFAEENEDFSSPTAILNHVSDIHDRRFRLRPYCEVIVYAGGDNSLPRADRASDDAAPAAAAACAVTGTSDDDDDDGAVMSSRELVVSFAECLLSEKKITKDILLVEGGIELIMDTRPYLVKGTDSFADVQFPNEIVEDFMYLGSFNAAANRQCIDLLGITHVLNATNACESVFQGELKYLQCEVEDDLLSDIEQYFEPALAFIEEAMSNDGSRILIHCKMGMSRSAAFVILFLMKSRRMSLRKAYNFVKTIRPFVNPNPSFLKQLAVYETQLFGSSTIRFPDEPLTLGTLFEWLQDDGKTWVKRVVVSKASG